MSRTTNHHTFKKILLTAFALASLAGTTFAEGEWSDPSPCYGDSTNRIVGYDQLRFWWTGSEGNFTSEVRFNNVITDPLDVEFYYVNLDTGKESYEGGKAVLPGETGLASHYNHSNTNFRDKWLIKIKKSNT